MYNAPNVDWQNVPKSPYSNPTIRHRHPTVTVFRCPQNREQVRREIHLDITDAAIKCKLFKRSVTPGGLPHQIRPIPPNHYQSQCAGCIHEISLHNPFFHRHIPMNPVRNFLQPYIIPVGLHCSYCQIMYGRKRAFISSIPCFLVYICRFFPSLFVPQTRRPSSG